jgi:hypothetical protein
MLVAVATTVASLAQDRNLATAVLLAAGVEAHLLTAAPDARQVSAIVQVAMVLLAL